MTQTNDTREVDGYEGSISAEISRYGYVYDSEVPNMIKVATQYGQSAELSPAAARVLAAHLIELADEADVRNLEAAS